MKITDKEKLKVYEAAFDLLAFHREVSRNETAMIDIVVKMTQWAEMNHYAKKVKGTPQEAEAKKNSEAAFLALAKLDVNYKPEHAAVFDGEGFSEHHPVQHGEIQQA